MLKTINAVWRYFSGSCFSLPPLPMLQCFCLLIRTWYFLLKICILQKSVSPAWVLSSSSWDVFSWWHVLLKLMSAHRYSARAATLQENKLHGVKKRNCFRFASFYITRTFFTPILVSAVYFSWYKGTVWKVCACNPGNAWTDGFFANCPCLLALMHCKV